MTSIDLKIVTSVNVIFDWIDQQLNKRGWSNSELARNAGLSHSAISMVRNGQRGVTFEFCLAIAQAFGERPEKIFRIAGLLPASAGVVDDLTKEEAEVLELWRSLPTDEQSRKLMFDFLKGWVESNREQ